MIQQLRIYEIFEHNKAAFHARFRDHAARIMRTRYGFQIVAMWETRFGDRTEFVMSWSGLTRRPKPRYGRPSWPTRNGPTSSAPPMPNMA